MKKKIAVRSADTSEMVQVYGEDIEFDKTKDWDDHGEFNINLTTEEALNSGAKGVHGCSGTRMPH